jgi:hypothetical protein
VEGASCIPKHPYAILKGTIQRMSNKMLIGVIRFTEMSQQIPKSEQKDVKGKVVPVLN